MGVKPEPKTGLICDTFGRLNRLKNRYPAPALAGSLYGVAMRGSGGKMDGAIAGAGTDDLPQQK